MEILGGLLILATVVGVPGLIWYFIVRRIVRGNRAKREVKTLAETLSDAQLEEFDQTYLPRASNIFEQRALLIRYIEETNKG